MSSLIAGSDDEHQKSLTKAKGFLDFVGVEISDEYEQKLLGDADFLQPTFASLAQPAGSERSTGAQGFLAFAEAEGYQPPTPEKPVRQRQKHDHSFTGTYLSSRRHVRIHLHPL